MRAIKITASFLLAAATMVSALPSHGLIVARNESSLEERFQAARVSLKRRGSLDVGSPCSADADCITGWCAFAAEVGLSAPQQQRFCRRMPATGPCSVGSQCTTGGCSSDGVCNRSGETGPYYQTATNNGDCASGWLYSINNFGWSVQADSTLLRSERTFRSAFCRPTNFDKPCQQVDDCGSTMVCDKVGQSCVLLPPGRTCTSHGQCSTLMCGTGPRTLDNPNTKYCLPVPAGSPCQASVDGGSKLCRGSSNRICSTSQLYGACFWDEDCPPGVKCDPVALTCGVQAVTSTSTTTSTTTTSTTTTTTTTSTTTSSTPTSTKPSTTSKPPTSTPSTTTKTTTSSTKTTSTPLPSAAGCTASTQCRSGYCRKLLLSDGKTRASTGTCEDKKANNTACYTNEGCISGVCNTGAKTCTPLGLNAPCTSNAQCGSSYCRQRLLADGTRDPDATCDVQKGQLIMHCDPLLVAYKGC
ncbi:hypothetical protein V8E36_000050 [Tilletia maclaganii]